MRAGAFEHWTARPHSFKRLIALNLLFRGDFRLGGLMNGLNVGPKRRFQLVLIKPSHYGDDGYVIRWWRSMVPSNSLASIYGIAADSAARGALGEDIDIDIEAIKKIKSGTLCLFWNSASKPALGRLDHIWPRDCRPMRSWKLIVVD